jgi:hypothetical protein
MSSKPVDTAIVMVVGPCIDNTDFKSLEEAIAYNAAGMDISLIVEKTDGTSAVTAITLTTGGTSDWTHKDGGYYEVEITAAQNAEEGIAYLRGVCDGVLPFESVARYDIVKANIYDSLIKGTDVLQVDVTQLLGTAWLTPGVAGTPDVNAKLIGATAQTGRDIGASVLLSAGTGAGQLDFTSGIVKSNLTQILAHLLTQTGTQLADGFEHFFDVATPTGTLDSLPAAAPNAAGGLPISAAGGLAMDTLADWINGGRLDNLLDAIPTTAMRGTDGANTTVPDTAGIAATPAEVATALTDIHLDHLFAANYDPASKPGVATALLNELIENDGGVSRYTANALEQAPSGGTNPNVLIDTTISGAPSSQTVFVLAAGSDIDDAYKDQAIVLYDASNNDYPSVRKVSDYTGATKTITLDSAPDFTIIAGDGVKTFVTAPGTTAPTVGQIRAEMEGVGYFLDLIKTDTNELQTDWVNGGRLDLILDIIAADTTTDIPALIATAQADLDLLTGADGATLATLQGNYAPNKVVPDVAGTLATYDPPTNAEMVAAFTEIKGGTWSATDTLEAIRDRGDSAWITATGFSTHSAANVWAVSTRALTDKSGFALSAAGVNLIWDDLISGITQVGSIGKLIADNLDATMTSRSPANEYDTQIGYIPSNLGDVPIASELNSAHGAGSWATATGFSTHAAADIWSVGTRALTDKSGFALSTAGIDALWDDLISGMTQVGSIGKLIADNLNATISSRNATTPPTVGAIRTEMEGAGTKLTLTLADTAELQGNQSAWATATSVTVSDKTGFALSAAGVDAILDENIEGTHTLREIMRLLGAYAAGKSSGGGTASITFRDLDDSKDRIVATVTSVGNRTAVTLTED